MNDKPNPPTNRPSAASRRVRRLLFSLACVVILIALFYAEENIRGKLAWNAYVHEVEAKGESLEPAKLIPPPVPDDQNFTLCPLLKPLFDLAGMPSGGPDATGTTTVGQDTNGLARLDAFNVYTVIENQLKALPDGEERDARMEQAGTIKASLPLSNGWVNLKGFEDYLSLGTNLDGVVLTKSAARNVLLALGPFEGDLTDLQDCSKRRPRDRWPIRYDTNDPPAILLPHLARMKAFCQLLQLSASAHLAAGETAEAMEDVGLAVRLAESVRDEPFVISQLLRLASCQLIMQPVKEGLSRHQFTEPHLLDLQRQSAAADVLSGAVNCIHGERSFFGVAVGEISRRDPGYVVDQFEAGELGSTLVHLIPNGWFYQNQVVTCRLLDRYGSAPIDLNQRRIHPYAAGEIEAALERSWVPFRILARMIVAHLPNTLMRLAEGQALMDQAVIACALERHYLVNGRYPETLEALSPQFLDKVPHDVITGGPMIYHPTPDGRYLLYSVGWDGNDDGGAPPKRERYNREAKEDWVWMLPDPKLQPY